MTSSHIDLSCLLAHDHGHTHDNGADLSRIEVGEDLEGEAQAEGHSHEAPESTDMRRFFEKSQLRPAEDLHQDPDSLRLSMFAQELILSHKNDALQKILQRITYQLRVRRARNIFNPGGLAPISDGDEIPIDISAAEVQDLVDHLHELEVDEDLIRQLTAQTDNILEGLPEMLKGLLARQKELAKIPRDGLAIQQRSLRKLLDFSPAEQRDLEHAIRRLARQIHGARNRRMKRDRVGRINVAHTLRRNMRYEGIPFEPALRRRRAQRPRLVVLCDVSLSTRNLARFWLHMAHQVQSLFSQVRTFVFVADMVEVTFQFQDYSLHRAVESVFGGKLLDVDTNSDFGRAAGQFRDTFLNAVNRRTTVVILGDGRNNGKPPNVEALQEIARHARRVIWMTPEPKYGWSLGSCDMPLYEPHCQRVEVVRTVEQLAHVAEELVRNKSSLD